MPGSFPMRWIHGSEDCAANTDPPLQVHAYDPDTLLLRQNKCSDPPDSFEGPFMYLLFGEERALLIDTGASADPTRFPIGRKIREHLEQRRSARAGRRLPLVVCHSHGHGDHFAGDEQVVRETGAARLPPGLVGLAATFGVVPDAAGTIRIDLGGRTLDATAIPGHEPQHIVLYDRGSRLLFTGDTLYPGLLTVSNWTRYRQSVRKLADLVAREPVDFVLGAHIEMKNRPREIYPPRHSFQPEEHVLQLEARHVNRLHEFVQDLGPDPRRGVPFVDDEFAILRF